eukprot:TRINITY_DN12457_c0_g1_i1.p1 TRINITY_DN12457_c0_g1~~TRINITY_DN12457_c0_g1_i1.p1  ORF type:complete len:177 (-),score=30.83 TRINITY_DN12457_c0_g1_i1:64-594(-)
MPVLVLKKQLISAKSSKTAYQCRTLLEIYGTHVAALNEFINLIDGVEFMSTDTSRHEVLHFHFQNGRYQWLSEIQYLYKQDTYDNNEQFKVQDELFEYTIQPKLLDLLAGRRWRLVAMKNDTIHFWRPDPAYGLLSNRTVAFPFDNNDIRFYDEDVDLKQEEDKRSVRTPVSFDVE